MYHITIIFFILLSFHSFAQRDQELMDIQSKKFKLKGKLIFTDIENYTDFIEDTSNFFLIEPIHKKYNLENIVDIQINQKNDSLMFNINNIFDKDLFLFSTGIQDNSFFSYNITYLRRVQF